ncbi:MAG: hypothetical protein PHC61_18425 [Chitinivibrionales bacterium]|nr:hypothetical protein [Chitinivibrionales bacterium]
MIKSLNITVLAMALSLLPTITHAQGDIDLSSYSLVFSDEFNAVSWTSSNPKGTANWATSAPFSDKVIGFTDHDPASMTISNGVLINKL